MTLRVETQAPYDIDFSLKLRGYLFDVARRTLTTHLVGRGAPHDRVKFSMRPMDFNRILEHVKHSFTSRFNSTSSRYSASAVSFP